MPKPQGLMKRKGSANWHYRQRRPAHLSQPGLRSHEIVSLGTADYSEAIKKLPEAQAILAARFRDALQPASVGIVPSVQRRRRPDSPHLPILTIDDASRLSRDFFRRELQQLDLSPVFKASLDPLDAQRTAEELDDRIAALSSVNDDDEHPGLAVEIGLLVEAGFRAPFDSRPSIALREYCRRALLQIAKIERARFEGDFGLEADDPLFRAVGAVDRPLLAAASLAAPESPSVSDAAEMFLAQLLLKPIAEKTQDRYRRELAHIVAFFGESTPIGSVRRRECEELRDGFALLSPNFGKGAGKGATIRELIAARRPDSPVLQWETHDKYLSMLRQFIAWAHRRDYTDKDYAAGLTPLSAKPDGSMAKLPFERDELIRIFSRPIYTGCLNDEYGFSRSGPNIVRRSRYWAPLIALFSGLRAGEILQLTPAHFRQTEAGTNFIILTPDMQLKNENAQREVPVHPVLEQIGLLSWVDRRRDDTSAPLFPEVTRDKYDAESPIFSKRYKSDLKHLELGERRKKLTFHSYRHTFKHALDNVGVKEQPKDELCGWSRGKKTGRRYGTGLNADVLRPYLEQVTYEIDLSPLFAHASRKD